MHKAFLLDPANRPVLDGDRTPLRLTPADYSLFAVVVGVAALVLGVILPLGPLLQRPLSGNLIVVLLLFLAALGTIVSMVGDLVGLLRLAREGRVVPGRLDEASGEMVGDALMLTVHYTFEDGRGLPRSGQARARRDDLKGQPSPAEGTPVWIVTAGSKHHRLL